MIAFKGRLSFKQYLPAKPTKFGIKVWERASPQNGYCHEFQIYTGKVEGVRTEESFTPLIASGIPLLLIRTVPLQYIPSANRLSNKAGFEKKLSI
jgi:hypothetical protein